MEKDQADDGLVSEGQPSFQDEPVGNTEPGTEHNKQDTEPSSEDSADLVTESSPARRPLRRPGPRSCKPYMRKRLARALPEIADALLEKAAQGKLPELKMLMQLSGLHDKETGFVSKRFGGRTFEQILLEDWRKETTDAAAANAIANGDTHPTGNTDGNPEGHADDEADDETDSDADDQPDDQPDGPADNWPFDQPGFAEIPPEPPRD